MLAHGHPLVVRQCASLEKDFVRHTQLPKIVQECPAAEVGDLRLAVSCQQERDRSRVQVKEYSFSLDGLAAARSICAC